MYVKLLAKFQNLVASKAYFYDNSQNEIRLFNSV